MFFALLPVLTIVVFSLTGPYEQADITLNTYYNRLLDHAFLLVPTQASVVSFILVTTRYAHHKYAFTEAVIASLAFKSDIIRVHNLERGVGN